MSASASAQRVAVPTPQHHKIVQDIQECIKQMKDDFSETKIPVNDDNQTLHRFCAKLEYLLQANMKERYSMLGRRKDYWDYFVDCLGSTKGINDGIKYVKSLGEHKSSLGKGRAFLRFSLVHQRLPDTIQQCVQHPKTGEWFHPQSVWYQKGLRSELINSLYDLTDVHFDLSPRGYDLDTAWPSFAKKQGGNYTWNPPSRRSSIGSMASISMQDTSSLLSMPLYADNSSEVDKLTQDLETSETVRTQLMDQVGSLQQEKMEVSQSAWSTQGELHAMQEQLRDLQEQHTELQERHLQLEKRHDKMCIENGSTEKDWLTKEQDLTNQLQALREQKTEADGQLEQVRSQLDDVRREVAAISERHKEEVERLDAERTELLVQTKALEKEISLTSESERRKGEQIESLEVKVKVGEEKNTELLTKLQESLDGKESKATSQLEAANKLHEVVASLKEVELANVRLQAANEELTKKCEQLEKDVETVEQVKSGLEETVLKVKQDSEKNMLIFQNELKDLTESNTRTVESLQADLMGKNDEVDLKRSEIEKLSSEVSELKLKSGIKDNMLVQCYTKFNLLAGSDSIDDVDGSQFEVDNFLGDVKLCQETISKKMSEMREEIQQLTLEKGQLESEREKLASEKEHIMDNLDELRKAFGEFQQSNETQQRDLDLVHAQTESELRQSELELQEKEADLKKLSGRLDEHEEAVLDVLRTCRIDQDSVDASDCRQTMSSISLHVQKLSTKISDMESEKEILQGKLNHLQAGESDKGTQLQNLEEKFSSLQKSLGDARELESSLRSDLTEKERLLQDQCSNYSDLTTKHEKLVDKCSSLDEENEQMKSDNISLREEVTTLTHDLNDLKVTLATTNEKLQTAEDLKGKDVQHQEEVGRLKDKEISEKDNIIKSVENEKQNLKDDLEKTSKLKSQIEKEKGNLEGEVSKVKTLLSSSQNECQNLQGFIVKEQTSRQEVEQKLKISSEEVMTLKVSVTDVRTELKSQEEKYEEMLLTHEKERNQLNTQLEEALSDTQIIKAQLKETSDELEQACSLKERAEQEKEEVTTILKNLEASYRELKAKLNLFENEGQEIASAKESIEKEKESLMSELDKLKESLKDLETEKDVTVTEKEEAITLLEGKLEESKCQLEQFEENVLSLEKNKETLLDQLREAEEDREGLKKSLDQAEKNMGEKESNNEELQMTVLKLTSDVTELEKSLEERSRRCEELESMSGQQSGLQTQIESLNQEISALQFQLSSEQMQHEESLRSYTSQDDEVTELTNKLAEQEATIVHLEQEVTSLQTGREEETNKVTHQVESLTSQLKERNEDNNKLTEKLQMTETELVSERDARERLETDMESVEEKYSQQLHDKDEEITGLKADMKQLKRKLLKLIKDKDQLWQKTDQLAYQQKVQAKETWMDNSTATNCLKCKAEFSIWLRRHHCRLCGRIYCWKCVDHWVMTAHSSKKERVCDECITHKQSMESDNNTSLLSNISDDEDIDEELLRSLTVRGSSQSTDDLSSTQDETTESDTSSQILPPPLSTPGSPNATDEHKVQKMHDHSVSVQALAPPKGATVSPEREDPFHVITDEEVSKSLTEYDPDTLSAALSANMTSSMILSAEELENGEINRQNEIWIKPGKTFVVPITIDTVNTELCWEFTSQPKDVVFSVKYRENESAPVSEAEDLVPPCKCDSHKQAVQGTLTAKQTGLYTLVFDNTYSRMTAKRIHYSLQSRSSS
ncbi:FYVE and coiled-coil domain-containing protein 1-like isoform X1 [Haliotis cracherodii]|uniref:FYVE and coiled-coil domain-containing protein 1-like isoform X1 n=1 Tax=Haliotis cracherodii TaxID=6455 RepID=UPI0039EB18FC